jgi:hypothetical protein
MHLADSNDADSCQRQGQTHQLNKQAKLNKNSQSDQQQAEQWHYQ